MSKGKKRGRPRKVNRRPVETEVVQPVEEVVEPVNEVADPVEEETVQTGNKVCESCGNEFQPSKFTPYQKFCQVCGSKKKAENIQLFRQFKSKATIDNYIRWKNPAPEEQDRLHEEVKILKRSALYRYFKDKDPQFINAIKAGEV